MWGVMHVKIKLEEEKGGGGKGLVASEFLKEGEHPTRDSSTL